VYGALVHRRGLRRDCADINHQAKGTDMTDSAVTTGVARFEVRVTADSHFAWVRTRLSLERTMMSWLRTATALIGFGFAIVQYFNRLGETPGARAAYGPNAPKLLGLALIFCGVASLLIAIWQYRWTTHYLWGQTFRPIAGMTDEGKQSPVMAVAVVLIAVGVVAFFAVLFRLT
jgi:putative membrane protein